MLKAGVPCIPGYQGEAQDDASLQAEATRIGYPLMIKAAAGGGGRGMRLVHDPAQLLEQLRTAKSEALNAFGSDLVILERAVLKPRHIEIQVFADTLGNAVYLGERDCSVQRRHQKVIEEAPSPFVTPELRKKMGEAAVNVAKACAYVGAGTVEFLVDAERNFYFLEMNTRLQVEHPVTEMITGQDLVAWQIKVALGQSLPLTQEQIVLCGHAIEVRLYAEDPRQNFLPQTGTIQHWKQHFHVEGVRVDSGVRSGQNVSAFYDPMLAKVIAWGQNREEARRKLLRTLEHSPLFGVTVNSHFLTQALRHPAFVAGEATTAFIQEYLSDDISLKSTPVPEEVAALSALIAHLRQSPQGSRPLLGAQASWPYLMRCGDAEFRLRVNPKRGPKQELYQVTLGEHSFEFSDPVLNAEQLEVGLNGVRRKFYWHGQHAHIALQYAGQIFGFDDRTHAPPQKQLHKGSGQLNAPMDGAIVAVHASVGQVVKHGETLMVLEAMKMEHPIKADIDGIVGELPVKPGQQVKLGQRLVLIAPEATSDE
jgi:geranyl-CoA carboxylase alpha subunit